MEIKLAVSKVPKWGKSQAGDTIEVVERPRGGLSAIMADGQGSGPAARRTSNLVVHKAMSLIADGARDGAVGRAVHDYLHAVRGGQILCTLTILSVDLDSGSLVVARNGNAPVMVFTGNGSEVLHDDIPSIGVHSRLKPDMREFPLEPGLLVVAFTDGVSRAGQKSGEHLGVDGVLDLSRRFKAHRARDLADSILKEALIRDRGRPGDDMSVVTIGLAPAGHREGIRRMTVTMPVKGGSPR